MNEKQILSACDNMVATLSITMRKRYVLAWTGTKVPRGAKIGNIEIAWTQHGMVRGIDGGEIGYYERTKEYCNARKEHDGRLVGEQEMIVAADEQVFDTEGKPCPEYICGALAKNDIDNRQNGSI